MYSTHLCRARYPLPPLNHLLTLCYSLLVTSSAAASISLPLPSLEPNSWSDLAGQVTSSIAYQSGTGAFGTISGTASQIKFGPGPTIGPIAATFSISGLDISVDSTDTSHGFVNSGTFTATLIHALASGLSYPSGVMLSGPITDLKFNGSGVLEMSFDITGGSALMDFGTMGALRIASSLLPGDLLANFTVLPPSATIDIFGAVPEPTSFAVFAGLVTASALLRRTHYPGLQD